MLITIDISPNPPEEGGGFLYAVYTDDGDNLNQIGSGQGDTISDLFVHIKSLTERTLL